MTDVTYDPELPARPAASAEMGTATPFRLDRLSTDRILVILAGVCAIGFGALAFILQLGDVAYVRPMLGFTDMGSAVFTFALSMCFGLFLILAFGVMAQRAAEGAILALAFGVVLLLFGGTPGVIAGILALVGSVLGLVRNVKLTG